MSGNNNPENWRNVTGIGHGQNWGAPTAYSKNGTAWGKAMNPSAVNNDKASPATPAKGLNATAPSFTPTIIPEKMSNNPFYNDDPLNVLGLGHGADWGTRRP
ncbi:hypothetical protein BKA58DRAFT_434773 [Alternaria rosae]|uniref:uncharacterized protein n=1 Tax=Alternaria rosae TaxID=1187941 RepID=UPI001E8DF7F8|nr:uncharacterized protein BKA58DRAFT_434773 [Alternaria rosae]KAH6883014.1 hypothetical protein BKA58DRAFT_434773 [Alternaria rosae]